MRKGIVLLIVALVCGCSVFASNDTVPPAVVATTPTVTLSQEQFDSLIAASAKSHQMELIAKEESEKMFSSYTTHVGWVVGIVVGLFGVALPYAINRRNLNEIRNIKRDVNATKEAAAKDAHDAKAYAIFAWARQFNQEDLDRAIELYNRAIVEKKDFGEAYVNRGNAYGIKGNHDQAIKDYDKAIELNPQGAYAYNNRGYAYFKKGDYDQAIKDYVKAIELNPKYAKAYINQGVAYMRRGNDGDLELAMNDFKTGLSLNPDESTRKLLEKYMEELKAKMQQPKEGE